MELTTAIRVLEFMPGKCLRDVAEQCDELTYDGDRRYTSDDGSFAMGVLAHTGDSRRHVVRFDYDADAYDKPEDWLCGPLFAHIAKVVSV